MSIETRKMRVLSLNEWTELQSLQEAKKPKILERLVKQLKHKGYDKSKAYAIAISSLQKSGSLKKGSTKATKKGVRRGNMTAAERAKDRESKRTGNPKSKYTYSSKTNRATLGEGSLGLRRLNRVDKALNKKATGINTKIVTASKADDSKLVSKLLRMKDKLGLGTDGKRSQWLGKAFARDRLRRQHLMTRTEKNPVAEEALGQELIRRRNYLSRTKNKRRLMRQKQTQLPKRENS